MLKGSQADKLTAKKSEQVMNRDGHVISGFVLCHPDTGHRCIIEMSAVRWLTNKESWWLMHESESPLNAEVCHGANNQQRNDNE